MGLQISVLSKRAALSDPLPGTARVYVGRPSALGNPFAMAEEADRARVVRKYRHWLQQRYSKRGSERAELERLLQLSQAGPLELVCWCAPLACHADVIREALLGMHAARQPQDPEDPEPASGPRIIQGMLDYGKPWSSPDVYLFTGNPVRRKNGAIVMGRGAAQQVRDTYPGVDLRLGNIIRDTPGRPVVFLELAAGQVLGWFQVKHHWQQPADLDLIEASARELASVAAAAPGKTFHLNAPGIGNGKLSWEEVYPLLQVLPTNVVIYR